MYWYMNINTVTVLLKFQDFSRTFSLQFQLSRTLWKILLFNDFSRTFQDSDFFPGFPGFPGRVGTLIVLGLGHEIGID